VKASKNHNNVVSEERLAHIRTIIVSLCGKLTYVFLYCNYGIALTKVCGDFWSVNLILLFVALTGLLGLQMSSFVVYEDFGCLCLAYRT
jgi:hypothetical protein